MADLSITAGNVVAGSNASKELGVAGATITAGQVVYKDSADGKFKLADANSATVAARTAYGIALNGASDGQPLQVQTSGDITIGATVTVGNVYVLSGTPGGIGVGGGPGPASDLVSGWYTNVIGVGQTSAILTLRIFTAGVAVP